MRRTNGFTLIELMGSLSLLGAVSVAVGGLALHADKLRDLGAAYASDIEGTRRALDLVERDLRAARDVRVGAGSLTTSSDAGDVAWKLDGSALRRADVIVARNIAAFTVRRDGDVVEVSLELGRRSPDATRTASVSTSVLLRAASRSRR